jgi:hypothetical protein
MNNLDSKTQIDSVHGLVVNFLKSWAKRELGLVINTDETRTSSSRDGNERFVSIEASPLDHNKTLCFFLSAISLRFTIGITKDEDGESCVAVYGIGISFDHKSGGSNGWSTEASFVVSSFDGAFVLEQKRPWFRKS